MSSSLHSRRPLVAVATLLLGLVLTMAAPAWAQDGAGADLPALRADRPVIDLTGASLTEAQISDIQQRLEALGEAGADGVVVVRELDATPDETLEQVEALQQAWVAATGVEEVTAVAVLINREPGEATSARAGVFVGRDLQEGNVPEREQRAIVDDALIPPLRDGDVHGSLVAGLDRLTSSVIDGPPVSAAERWAARAADTWLPWVSLGAAALLLALALRLHTRRQVADQVERAPTTARPGDLPPAVVAALVTATAQPTGVPATLLDLAARGAVDIEQEREAGRFRSATAQVRTIDADAVGDPVGRALWDELVEQAEEGVVDSGSLGEVAGSSAVVEAVHAHMAAAGWSDDAAAARRVGLGTIAVIGGVLAVAAGILTGIAGALGPALIGTIALALVVPVSLWLLAAHPRLSVAGQREAGAWRAYRDGLAETMGDDAAPLDLDAALPDLVAMGLTRKLDDRLEAAAQAGMPIRAFTSATSGADVSPALYVAMWSSVSSSTSPSAGAGAATVSGGGASGGGGAAGST